MTREKIILYDQYNSFTLNTASFSRIHVSRKLFYCSPKKKKKFDFNLFTFFFRFLFFHYFKTKQRTKNNLKLFEHVLKFLEIVVFLTIPRILEYIATVLPVAIENYRKHLEKCKTKIPTPHTSACFMEGIRFI